MYRDGKVVVQYTSILNPFTGGINVIPKSFPDSARFSNFGNDCISLTFEVSKQYYQYGEE